MLAVGSSLHRRIKEFAPAAPRPGVLDARPLVYPREPFGTITHLSQLSTENPAGKGGARPCVVWIGETLLRRGYGSKGKAPAMPGRVQKGDKRCSTNGAAPLRFHSAEAARDQRVRSPPIADPGRAGRTPRRRASCAQPREALPWHPHGSWRASPIISWWRSQQRPNSLSAKSDHRWCSGSSRHLWRCGSP